MSTKRCPKCQTVKDCAAFGKQSATRDGLTSHCRACRSAHGKIWYQANRELQAKRVKESANPDARLLREYGITVAERDAMLASQGGACAICGRPVVKPNVDHDHRTGKVRGILCTPCNTGIGLLGDSAERVASAAAYLIRSEAQVMS